MKTDDRMAERIAHLERETKILKNEVQAVLVDLKTKFMEDKNPFGAPSEPASSQQVIVLQSPAAQSPAAGEAGPGAEAHGGTEVREEQDKIEEPAGISEEIIGEMEEPARASDELENKAEEPSGEKHPEAAREEVAKAQIPEDFPVNAGTYRGHTTGREINLISVSGLVNWAEESVKKLGHQKTEAILDVAELMGLLSPQLKQIMIKLINIDREDGSQSVSARAFLDSLVRITTLLGKDNQTEAALLSILSEEEEEHG